MQLLEERLGIQQELDEGSVSGGILCQLKNKNVYQSNRVMDEKYEYHLRNKAVNVDISCPTAVTNEDASFWANNPLDATGMTSTTKCGLAAFTENERRVVSDKKELLDTAVNSDFKSMVDRFVDKYTVLKNNLFSTTASTADAAKELKKKEADMGGSIKNDQYKQLQAMSEDTDFIMMSQNYRHYVEYFSNCNNHRHNENSQISHIL